MLVMLPVVPGEDNPVWRCIAFFHWGGLSLEVYYTDWQNNISNSACPLLTERESECPLLREDLSSQFWCIFIYSCIADSVLKFCCFCVFVSELCACKLYKAYVCFNNEKGKEMSKMKKNKYCAELFSWRWFLCCFHCKVVLYHHLCKNVVTLLFLDLVLCVHRTLYSDNEVLCDTTHVRIINGVRSHICVCSF
jgi:hypothetical protein